MGHIFYPYIFGTSKMRKIHSLYHRYEGIRKDSRRRMMMLLHLSKILISFNHLIIWCCDFFMPITNKGPQASFSISPKCYDHGIMKHTRIAGIEKIIEFEAMVILELCLPLHSLWTYEELERCKTRGNITYKGSL